MRLFGVNHFCFEIKKRRPLSERLSAAWIFFGVSNFSQAHKYTTMSATADSDHPFTSCEGEGEICGTNIADGKGKMPMLRAAKLQLAIRSTE